MSSPSGSNRNYTLIPAIVVILMGVFFLLRNLDAVQFGEHAWAWFLFIPPAYILMDVWRKRQANAGRIPPSARVPLLTALLISAIAVIFLLGIDWGDAWPIFLVFAGLAALLGGWQKT